MIISDLSHLQTIESNEIQGGRSRRFNFSPTINTNVNIATNTLLQFGFNRGRGGVLQVGLIGNSQDNN